MGKAAGVWVIVVAVLLSFALGVSALMQQADAQRKERASGAGCPCGQCHYRDLRARQVGGR
jgi:cytochrome c553